MQTCFRNLKKENHLRHLFVPQNPTFHSFLPELAHKKLYSVRGVDFLGESFGCHLGFCVPISPKACHISDFVPNQDKAAVEHRFLLCKCTSMCVFVFQVFSCGTSIFFQHVNCDSTSLCRSEQPARPGSDSDVATHKITMVSICL